MVGGSGSRWRASRALILGLCLGACSGSQRDKDLGNGGSPSALGGVGGSDAGSAGTSATSAGASSGGSLSTGAGGEGAGGTPSAGATAGGATTEAGGPALAGSGGIASDPDEAARARAEPIRVRVIGFTDVAGGHTTVPYNDTTHPECWRTPGKIENQDLDECIAEGMVTDLNRAFSELPGAPDELFVLHELSFVDAAMHRFVEPTPDGQAGYRRLAALMKSEHNHKGFLNIFIVQNLESLAPHQPLNEHIGAVAITVKGTALEHEVGHVFGFPHVGGSDRTATLNYGFCGGFTTAAAVMDACPCESNWMGDSTSCATCVGWLPTFNTPAHGPYLADILECWRTERRFIPPDICGVSSSQIEGQIDCRGYDRENGPLNCTCSSTGQSFDVAHGCDSFTSEEMVELCP